VVLWYVFGGEKTLDSLAKGGKDYAEFEDMARAARGAECPFWLLIGE